MAGANESKTRGRADKFIAKHEMKYPKAMQCLDYGLEDALSNDAYPLLIKAKKISSTNMLKRLNR